MHAPCPPPKSKNTILVLRELTAVVVAVVVVAVVAVAVVVEATTNLTSSKQNTITTHSVIFHVQETPSSIIQTHGTSITFQTR